MFFVIIALLDMKKNCKCYFVSETCLKREQKIKVRRKVITRVGKTDSTIFPI